ncbi:virulence-associated E family protein [Fuscibacter oryzae]|uniref:Virulence-associated protein E-like domain-containing protein n=1 Tax=Fuscibacter oryzae TaxID=2803939 RepID=A0A8J7MQ01_9RHOB|nr:virulence-associated E family protein [Fuscibacter oryzae]MBL4929025.1 hypothetical protein [Fuscibacter oryzae]
MAAEFQPNPAQSVQWLRWLHPDGNLYIETMASVGPAKPIVRQFAPGEEAQAADYIAAVNGEVARRNVYFLSNARFLNGSRKKENLSLAQTLHVDLDNKDYPGTEAEQLDRILAVLLDPNVRPKGVPEPTTVWFTGGGCQAIWKLAEPITVEAAEALNLAILAAMQGGPGTHNADRLLRLAWSMNWLNDKKRAAGRKPATAWQVHPVRLDAPPKAYFPKDFSLKVPGSKDSTEKTKTLVPSGTEEIAPLPLPADLMETVPYDPKWIDAIVLGKNPPHHDYASRSELVLGASIWMLSQGVLPGHVLSIITAPDLGISAHVRESPDVMRYAQRQVKRAMALLEAGRGEWPVLTEKFTPVAHHPKNVRYALARLAVDAQRNVFNNTDEIRGAGLEGRDLNDIAEILCSQFGRELDFTASPAAIKRELLALAHENPYHPIHDYLDGLAWDGTPRIDRWLTTYCGADDTEMNREFASKFLIAGVRRIKQPGCKFDTMMVFEGPQGVGKSQVAQLLAVREEWFCGSLDLRSDDKTKAELMGRAWIIECQELDGLNKATSQSLKRFLSTATDSYRRAYARDAGEYPRHCIILGTTNESTYLRDLTGNRRIWPVVVGQIDLERFSADLDQLWAEAVVREATGESIILSPHLWDVAKAAQVQRMVEDAYADVLEGAFEGITGRVSMESVKLLLGLDTAHMSPTDARRIRAAMDGLGWEYATHRLHDLGRRTKALRRGFAHGNTEERKVEYIARRIEGGIVVIERLDGQHDEETPF